MSSSVFPIPSGFTWLSPTYHPSPDEVRRYAECIALNEGLPRECAPAYAREAELQLWVWRNETHRRPPPRRTTPKAA